MSRLTHGPVGSCRIRGCHPLRPAVPGRSANPRQATGLLRFRSPLLAESRLMSFPPGTEMFQFPGFASPAYGFDRRYPKGVGCPIRTSTDQRLLAAPHGFSQRATSFIASWCQGIHRMPFSRSRSRPPNSPDIELTRHRTRPTGPIPPCAEATPTLARGCGGPAHGSSHSAHTTPLNANRPGRRQPPPTREQPPVRPRDRGTPSDAPEPIHPDKDHRAPRPPGPAHPTAPPHAPATAGPHQPHRMPPTHLRYPPTTASHRRSAHRGHRRAGFHRTQPEDVLLTSASQPSTDRVGSAGHGDDRVRTDDPLLAKQVLSQLSYVPS